MLSRSAVEVAVDQLSRVDFYDPKHGALFTAIEQLYARAQAIDPVTLASRTEHFTKAELAKLQANTPASANAGHYARVIAEAAYLRRAIGHGYALIEHGYDAELETVARMVADPALEQPLGTVEPGLDVNELMLLADQPVDWLVDGLLERCDRVVLTGPEGKGKTTLQRQFGLALAAGLHPFHFTACAPRRVLNIDLQDKAPQAGRAYRWIARRTGVKVAPGMLAIKERRQGMNLRSTADRRWLEALIRHHRAEVLIIGPAYKAWSGSPGLAKHSEEAVEELHSILDRITERYGCAIILEAHSPHGESGNRAEWRPYGASAWLRWSEFGVALQPNGDTTDLRHWRGERDRGRDWPTKLREGTYWPWVIADGTENEAGLL